MNKERPVPVPEGEEIVLRTEMEKAIFSIITNYGTSVHGEEYKHKQQAQAICQMFYELEEASVMCRDFRFVKVSPYV